VVDGLVTNRVDALVGALTAGLVLDLLTWVAPGEVDSDRANLPRLGEPLRYAVDHEDTRRTAQQGGVRRHQADRPGAVDRDGLPRRDARELASVVAGGKIVGEQRVVGLVLGARRQRQAVEVRVWDPQVLRVSAGVGAHGDVAVRPPANPGFTVRQNPV
jgi:hypothetical protein